MKALRKIIPAAAMLVLCAAMLTTATFAWFNMNESVSVDTGTTNVTAPVNIQIAKWSNTESTYTLGAYGSAVSYDDDTAESLKVNPVTVQKNESGNDLVWQVATGAGNDGAAVGDLKTVTPNADGVEGGTRYFKKYEMNIKNIGGTSIDVAIASVVIEAQDVSTDLYKSVCFMILIGEVRNGNAAVPAAPAVAATPAVVWDDGSGMHGENTVIKGTVEDKTKSFVTLTSQQTVDVTVIAWMEGNKAVCNNNNVKSESLAFAMSFDLTTETTPSA